MNNKRIKAGTLFNLKNFSHGLCVQGIGSQAINGLGGKGYQTAATEDLSGALEVFGGGWLNHTTCT